MKKIYLTAEMNVVRLANDVVTASENLEVGDPWENGSHSSDAPERRYRNGHYSEDYGFRD